MTMTRKKRAWISVILFAVIFAGLLVTATFTDLDVSRTLTEKALANHTYLTNDSAFGVALEAVGSSPLYLGLAFAFLLLFWFFARKKTFFNALLACGSLGGAFVANYMLVDDAMDYVQEHLTGEYSVFIEHSFIETPAWLTVIIILTALLFLLLGLFAVRALNDQQIESLFSFAIATIAFIAVSLVLVELIKGPVGRIRFRAMNMHPDDPKYGFSAFAKWYERNGQWIDKNQMLSLFGTTDALKSFPSGHTRAAGAAYFMPMLIDALKIKNKALRAALWICPVVITGLVAVSRIIVGAHFFSDVLVGGTIAFVCMILAREIFICKGANVKAMFGKDAA